MFDSMFSLDSPLGKTISKFSDILILNFLFLFFSLPIITMGASYTALYSVMRKLVKDEEGHIASGFLRAFKRNFKQSTIVWMLLLSFGCLLGAALYVTARLQMSGLNYILIVFLIPYSIELSYVFPLLSQFENSVISSIRNAILLGIAHLPWTILILMINLFPIILVFVQNKLIFIVPPLMLLIGFGLTAFCNCLIFNHIFRRYILSAEN